MKNEPSGDDDGWCTKEENLWRTSAWNLLPGEKSQSSINSARAGSWPRCFSPSDELLYHLWLRELWYFVYLQNETSIPIQKWRKGTQHRSTWLLVTIASLTIVVWPYGQTISSVWSVSSYKEVTLSKTTTFIRFGAPSEEPLLDGLLPQSDQGSRIQITKNFGPNRHGRISEILDQDSLVLTSQKSRFS